MIAIRINGGLGNQMLQYAAARSLSITGGYGMLIDTYQLDLKNFGNEETERSFELAIFERCRVLPRFRIKLVDCLAGLPSLQRQTYASLAGRCFPLSGYTCYEGYRTTDIAGFYALPDWTYLRGHYFSEQFFAPVAVEIREDFQFPKVRDRENGRLLEEIATRSTVAIHVRRTDYLQAANRNFAGVCDLDYYQRAVTVMETHLNHPSYYVFSDDPDWVAANLPVPRDRSHVVRHNTGTNAYEDMRLMASCDHQIIANSTFSWWAAWLNLHPRKMVIAPARWYMKYTGPSEDIIVPQGWLRI